MSDPAIIQMENHQGAIVTITLTVTKKDLEALRDRVSLMPEPFTLEQMLLVTAVQGIESAAEAHRRLSKLLAKEAA